jgi:hypothetical protein
MLLFGAAVGVWASFCGPLGEALDVSGLPDLGWGPFFPLISLELGLALGEVILFSSASHRPAVRLNLNAGRVGRTRTPRSRQEGCCQGGWIEEATEGAWEGLPLDSWLPPWGEVDEGFWAGFEGLFR